MSIDGDGAVDGNWWDSEVEVATAKENGSQEKGQLTITKMRSVQKYIFSKKTIEILEKSRTVASIKKQFDFSKSEN